MIDAGFVWWKQISSARIFIEKFVDAANSDKSIVLCLPKSVPWYDRMRDEVADKLNNNYMIEDIDSCLDNVGKFIFERFCNPNSRHEYRPNKTYAEFMAKRQDTVLSQKFVWVRNVVGSVMKEWLDFVCDYRKNVPKGDRPAVFILETTDAEFIDRNRKGIEIHSMTDEVSQYDRFIFCSLMATEYNTCKDNLKDYLSELVSNVCCEDIEMCAEGIKKGRQFMADTEGCLRSIIGSAYRSGGENFSFSFDEDVLERLKWEAQIRTVFPKLEDYRVRLIERHQKVIQERLERYPIYDSSGQEITDAYYVELGALNWLSSEGVLRLSPGEADKLRMYKDARNSLAHLKSIPFQDVEKILL